MTGKSHKVSKKRVSVNISEETETDLVTYSKREGVAMAWVIRKALIEFLERNLKQKELPMRLKDE